MYKIKRRLLFTITVSLLLTVFFPIQSVLANPDETVVRDLTKFSLEEIQGPTEADYKVIASFNTFSEAYAEMKKDTSSTSNLVIRNNASKSPMKILAANRAKAMSYPFRTGISKEPADVTMNIRSNKDLNNTSYFDTYINGYRQLDYFGTEYSSVRSNYVAQINIAGRKGYVDLNKIDIIPMIYIEKEWSMVLGGNTASNYGYSTMTRVVKDQYYVATTRNGRKEISYTYTNLSSGSTTSTTTYGIAPDWMSTGVRYYSMDGIEFYTDRNFTNKASNEKYYNYYQYLPVHSKSNVTASFLDYYLKDVRKISSTSVMQNLGYAFMNGQVKYDMNALLLYSLAILESGSGTSNIAKSKFNLFGWGAIDTSPGQSASEYVHPAQSVDQQMKHNLEAYTHVSSSSAVGNHFRGAYFGNKANGFNLMYASDPYWGMKVAGIAFTIDKENGFKDWGNYRLAVLKDKTDVPVRKSLNTNDIYYTTQGSARSLTDQTMIIVPDAQAEAVGFYKVYLITPMERYTVSRKTYYRELYDWETTFGYIKKKYVTQVAYSSGTSVNPLDPPLVEDPSVPEPTDPSQPISADTANFGSYKVTATAGLYLRKGPSMNYARVGGISLNTVIKGLPYNDGWHAVIYNGQAGFVSSEFITETVAPKTTMYEATGNNLNIRKEPTTTASILGSLNSGQTIQGVVYDNSWTWLMYNGAPAFVSSTYLKVVDSTPTVNKNVLKNALDSAKAINGDTYTTDSFTKLTTAITAAQAVYNSSSSTQTQVNAQVTALNTAISNLVKKPVVEPDLAKYRVTAKPNLRVRSAANTTSTVLGSLDHNTIIEAKPVGDGTWLQISFNGKTGYISANYTELVTTDSNTDFLSILGYDAVDTVLTGMNLTTTIDSVRKKLTAANSTITITVTDTSGKTLGASDVLKTGHVLKVKQTGVADKSYTIAVKGDISGDGVISTLDIVMVQRHLLKVEILTGHQAVAADISGSNGIPDGEIKTLDIVHFQRHLLKIESIN